MKENQIHRSSSFDESAENLRTQPNQQKLSAFRYNASAINKDTSSLLLVSSQKFSTSEVPSAPKAHLTGPFKLNYNHFSLQST